MVAFSSLYGRLLDQELGVEDSTVFTDARRKAAINDGIQEFNELTECLVRVSTIVWSGGTMEIDLNSTTVIADKDFIRAAAKQGVELHYTDASSFVTMVTGPSLPQRDVLWLDRHVPGWRFTSTLSTLAQLPAYWYLRPDGGALYLGMVPIPSTGSSASIKVLFPYVARPAVLTSDTSEPYTVGGVVRSDLRPFHRAVVNYAAHQLEKQKRNTAASEQQLQAFLSWVNRFTVKARQKGGTMLTYTRRYFRMGPD